MEILLQLPLFLAAVITLFLATTVCFDGVHFALHRAAASRWRGLRALGEPHQTHHRFLGADLEIHPEYERGNLRHHVLPEYLTQVSVLLALLWLLPGALVAATLALQTTVFALIVRSRGQDLNHRSVARLRAPPPFPLCLPAYHALHHVRPEAHFGSWTMLLDTLLGTATGLARRRALLLGTTAAQEAVLRAELEPRGLALRAGAPPAAELEAADLLILGSAQDVVQSREAWIETFKEKAKDRKVPVEVWSLAPESEPGLAGLARRYLRDERVIFRQVLLGGAPERHARELRCALGWIRRGAHWVPPRPGLRAARAYWAFRRELPAPPAGWLLRTEVRAIAHP